MGFLKRVEQLACTIPSHSLPNCQVLTYSPPGGGIIVPMVDKKGRAVPSNEEAERRAGYQAQIARLKNELNELGMQLDAEKAK